MMTLNTDSTVGEFVVDRPSRSRLFERLGIDYCCGGKTSLAEACRQKGLDAHTLLMVLDGDMTAHAANGNDSAHMTLTELADHIEATHHAWLRQELPRIQQLTEKVLRAHGEHHPWLNELSMTFAGLHAEMVSHMGKEEQMLFPLIRQMESGSPLPSALLLGITAPIHCMESEHEGAGRALETMRRISGDYTPPPDACNTFRALLDALASLERDLHEHVHKENNILFPRAIDLGQSRVQA